MDRQATVYVELHTEGSDVEIRIVRKLKTGTRRIIGMSEPEAREVASQLQRALDAASYLEDSGKPEKVEAKE